MMPNLAEIYDRRFFEEWGSQHQKYIEAAGIVTDLLFDLIQPNSLVDLGCGCGIYSHLFKEKKVKVKSIDGVQPPSDFSYPVPIDIFDLTTPIENKWGPFDMTLCLEVAEHIPEEYLNVFLKNLTAFGDFLVLSAAPPNQGGHHHVNEKPKRYWVENLAKVGFAYNRKKTGVFIEAFKKSQSPYMWMGEHISFYERISKKKGLSLELPFSVSLKK